ncbi:MAG: hypothetical protein ACRBCI_03985 [Cellvibrionaceae bacterium]
MAKLISVFFFVAVTTSVPAYSALVSHFGYTLDTDTNIVSGGGLEWLRWDRTIDDSVSTALYQNPSFRLASVDEMYGLLNTFSPVAVPETPSVTSYVRDSGEGIFSLINLMGEIAPRYNPTFSLDGIGEEIYSGAVFGGIDENGDSKYGRMTMNSTRTETGHSSSLTLFPEATLSNGFNFTAEAFEGTSMDWNVMSAESYTVALVREIPGYRSVPELSTASAPISILLLSSLLCLGIERRKKKRNA